MKTQKLLAVVAALFLSSCTSTNRIPPTEPAQSSALKSITEMNAPVGSSAASRI
jgi:hypothetical protein